MIIVLIILFGKQTNFYKSKQYKVYNNIGGNLKHQMKTSRFALMNKALLKSILPVLDSMPQQRSQIMMLGRVSAVSFSHKPSKQKKPKCTVCGSAYDNYLLFILHIEQVHESQIQVQKYEFTVDLLTIYFKQPDKHKKLYSHNYLDINNKQYFLSHSYEDRTRDILTRITGKFIKKIVKHKQQYFHSTDVFKEIRATSDGEESDDDIGHLERKLEEMRIGDFTDVNEQDKHFFITWNKLLREQRNTHVIVGYNELIDVLSQFAKSATQTNIKRLNLVMHGWTLWSAGLINADDVSNFLQIYDQESERSTAIKI